ncbi:hypothetical protein [Nevskia soli]|uniref:hypothetical protein n=1 Tax=Nevskia soli TaxID=418856 RepID=UPI0012FB13FA|nr:hypothetical protein [Nevskia soli]
MQNTPTGTSQPPAEHPMRIARITSLALLTFSAAAIAQSKPPTPETLGGPVLPATLVNLSDCASTTPSVVKSEKPVCSILPSPKPASASYTHDDGYAALLHLGACAASHGRFC